MDDDDDDGWLFCCIFVKYFYTVLINCFCLMFNLVFYHSVLYLLI